MKILDLLQDLYSKPNMMTMFNNNTLLRSPMTPIDSHALLSNQVMPKDPAHQQGPVLQRPNNYNRHPNFCAIQYLPTQRIWHVGINDNKNLSSPEDIHA
jgi:hypothetical protein